MIANALASDGLDVSIDLVTQSFGISYYVASTSSWSSLVPTGSPLGASMGNFTHLGWHLEDAVNLGVGGKNFFVDFSFQIPAPSALVPAGLAALATLRRRRR